MANPRIIYVSWPKAQAREMNAEAEQFKEGMSLKAKKTRGEWKIAYFGEGSALSGLPANSQIYVLGHSNAGKESISNGHDNLGYIEVSDRLIFSGLSRHYGGRLKFYNCRNALDATMARGENSFAAKAASYLRGNEFRNVRIFGYAALLTTPVAGLPKGYIPAGSNRMELGVRAVRVEYDAQGSPIMVQPVTSVIKDKTPALSAKEEYSSFYSDDEGED
jgi:hypothetical protein